MRIQSLEVLNQWRSLLQIKALGGLKAIVISHPHYYTTHLEWARIFRCPVYLSSEDRTWLNRPLTSTDAEGVERKFITTDTEEILPGVTAIKLGGHFPGSLVLHWDNKLFVADTLVTIPVCFVCSLPLKVASRM
jgi:glyoxylase-like metal-dependent hydrolase (beta-lactamase superfamily II)